MSNFQKLKIDIHIHLAGTGCCQSGCWVSPQFRNRFTFRAIKWLLNVKNEDLEKNIDVEWVHKIVHLIENSEIDYGVILGFDGVYHHDHSGFDEEKSQMLIPHQWVFKMAKENSSLLPGPSVNPFRHDALKILDECIAEKAVLIKWLPVTQAIDPMHRKLKPFYTRLAEAKIPLLIHMGGERTFAEVEPKYNDVNLLRGPLEAGVKVICAHAATKILGSHEEDQLPKLESLIREYPHLWVDNSGLCNPGRFIHVPRLAKLDWLQERMLYGSDWPVPSHSYYFLKELGFKKVVTLGKIKNAIQRDYEIKKAFRYSEESFYRANLVLANLEEWVRLN